jgi:hypothetical protein
MHQFQAIATQQNLLLVNQKSAGQRVSQLWHHPHRSSFLAPFKGRRNLAKKHLLASVI